MKRFLKKVFGQGQSPSPPKPQETKTLHFNYSQPDKKETKSEEPKLLLFPTIEPERECQIDIDLLPGEVRMFSFDNDFQTETGFVKAQAYFTNFRVGVRDADGDKFKGRLNEFYELPLGHIGKVQLTKLEDGRGTVELVLRSKYCRTFKFLVSSQKYTTLLRIEQLLFPRLQKSFALQYAREVNSAPVKSRVCPVYLRDQFQRQRVFKTTFYREVSNQEGKICDTYGLRLLMPADVSDQQVLRCSKYRSKGRLPALTYHWFQRKKAIFRSSQNMGGLIDKRSPQDQKMLRAIGDIGPIPSLGDETCHIFDARPWVNAVGNKFSGKGYQNLKYYTNCKIVFLQIQNIHVVREAFIKTYQAVTKEDDFYKALGEAGWLKLVATILQGAVRIVESLQSGCNVLVHCSDGWDRTSQLCALAQLLVDPYFRTIQGFKVLIQKDWLFFGHMFHTRGGMTKEKQDQRAPIFTQFLDCVHQLQWQHPEAFEFNLHYLLYLDFHHKALRFGDFLMDSEIERERVKLDRFASIWDRISATKARFINPFYSQRAFESLAVDTSPRAIRLWEELFMATEEGLLDRYGTHSDTKYNHQNLDRRQFELRFKGEVLEREHAKLVEQSK